MGQQGHGQGFRVEVVEVGVEHRGLQPPGSGHEPAEPLGQPPECGQPPEGDGGDRQAERLQHQEPLHRGMDPVQEPHREEGPGPMVAHVGEAQQGGAGLQPLGGLPGHLVVDP